MNSNYVIWGAIVTLSGAIIHSAGVVAGAIKGDVNYGVGSMIFGSILMLIGFLGPRLSGFLKRAYDEAPAGDKPKGDS